MVGKEVLVEGFGEDEAASQVIVALLLVKAEAIFGVLPFGWEVFVVAVVAVAVGFEGLELLLV